jgi:hypothetical protein
MGGSGSFEGSQRFALDLAMRSGCRGLMNCFAVSDRQAVVNEDGYAPA